MQIPIRTLAVLLVPAIAASTLAAPAAAGTPATCAITPSAPSTLPALSAKHLSAAIAGLPGAKPSPATDYEVSGALVQIRGSAGCWQATAGIADVHTRRPVPQNGRFRIGSMTKVFTAVVALQLVAEGRLDLDRTVQHYLPELLPKGYPAITVRQVLTYTSGISGTGVPHKDPAWFFRHRLDHWPRGSQLDVSKPPVFPPGTRQRYGNADYWLAGLLIEKITGDRWEQAVTSRIIRPLGLTGTSAPVHDPRIPGPHARGYESVGGHWVDVTLANPSLQWSAAGIISTAADLDHLIVSLFSGRLVPAAQLELMFTVPDVPTYDGDDDAGNDQPADYAIGLGRFRIGPVTVWGKSGDRPGYNNGVGATRDLTRRLVYSVNPLRMGGDQPAVAKRIIGAAFS